MWGEWNYEKYNVTIFPNDSQCVDVLIDIEEVEKDLGIQGHTCGLEADPASVCLYSNFF